MVACREMEILRIFLTEEDIQWVDKSDELICRTHFDFQKKHYSVINGLGTYGGQMNGSKYNQGLLEVMIDSDEPIGYLTAEEVVKLMYGEDK